MLVYAVDTETFFDSRLFTLKKMSTSDYIYDPRFSVHCFVMYNDKEYHMVRRGELIGFFNGLKERQQKGEKFCFIAQHAAFDGLIIDREFDFQPDFWIDTMSMSKAVSGLHVGHSLAALCERYGLADKTIAYAEFDGLQWEQMHPNVRDRVLDGCLDDAERTWEIARQMIPLMPEEELRVIDMTIRMFTEPCVRGDIEKLTALSAGESERKAKLLAELGYSEKDISSDAKFEQVLLDLGVEIEYKPAKNKSGRKGAFAKSDDFMQELINSDDPILGELAQLRVDIKSTIQESRANRFLRMAQKGYLPVYYYYYGARNSRFSGGDKTNFQNLPSRGANGKKLREALNPPDDCVFVVGDLAQIEARMLATIAGQHDKVQAFREGRDLYCEMATQTFGRLISAADEIERQCGKTQILQLGYGSGWLKYQGAIKRLTKRLLDDDEAKRHVQVYRNNNTAICGEPKGRGREGGLWQKGEQWLRLLHEGYTAEYWAPREAGFAASNQPLFVIQNHKIVLPNGLMLHYDGLEWAIQETEHGPKEGWWLPKHGGAFEFFYGSKLIQNINSALSRLCLTQAELRCLDRAPGGRFALHTHDDAAFVVPEAMAEEGLAIMKEEFTRTPSWLPNLPLSVKCEIRTDYAK